MADLVGAECGQDCERRELHHRHASDKGGLPEPRAQTGEGDVRDLAVGDDHEAALIREALRGGANEKLPEAAVQKESGERAGRGHVIRRQQVVQCSLSDAFVGLQAIVRRVGITFAKGEEVNGLVVHEVGEDDRVGVQQRAVGLRAGLGVSFIAHPPSKVGGLREAHSVDYAGMAPEATTGLRIA